MIPEHSWHDEKFKNKQINIWNDEINSKHFIEYLDNQPEKAISYLQNNLSKMKLQDSDLLIQLLQLKYPRFKWTNRKSLYVKKSQYKLKECLEQLFPVEGKNYIIYIV